MPHYLHTCVRKWPSNKKNLWWACEKCLPSFTPNCSICGAESPVIEVDNGFIGYEYGYLCSTCVNKVKQGGHWKKRRLKAIKSRADIILETYPDLKVVKNTNLVSQFEGKIDDRSVEIRLRVKNRDGERYIFHVEHFGGCDLGIIDAFRFPDPINRFVHQLSPKLTSTKKEWIRIGFRHLGKRDVLTVIESMLILAEQHDLANTSANLGFTGVGQVR